MESFDGGSEKYNLSTGISQRGEQDVAVFFEIARVVHLPPAAQLQALISSISRAQTEIAGLLADVGQ